MKIELVLLLFLFTARALTAVPTGLEERVQQTAVSHETWEESRKEETYLLATIVYLEARGESDLGQKAVAQVVLNRMSHRDFPDTMEGVIFQNGQFSPSGQVASTLPDGRALENARAVLEGERLLPETVVYFSVGKAAGKQPYKKIGNHWFCYE